ncbi:unnamed protein product [Chondrus crispus]|uniref:Uncharacterized protein n=1 Tax=Chondrus crispus TaxID=2769 RepID=R7QBQ7_CHOCR|nr:unnamed protein product [Chondrus crispus]CDF34900.1 unnamed protein product [Chondrus crispus]|eukprot:XP_005714719.1 unnamed protein product [Chondrus crispus]
MTSTATCGDARDTAAGSGCLTSDGWADVGPPAMLGGKEAEGATGAAVMTCLGE